MGNISNTAHHDPLGTAQDLIRTGSVTSSPNAEISKLIAERLDGLGFDLEELAYTDFHGIAKQDLCAVRRPTRETGSAKSGLAFLSHTDVVSTEGWNCEHGGALDANVADGRLWGRGACDMKGPIAAAIAAISRISPDQQKGNLYFLATGDEESGMAGAMHAVNNSKIYRMMVEEQAAGIVTEPTELGVVNSHKGACHLEVESHGVAAHSSTNDGINANWELIPFLSFLRDVKERCESEPSLQNSRFDPPTLSFNIVVQNTPVAANITTAKAKCQVFFRPMPNTDWRELHQELIDYAHQIGLKVSSSPPLLPLDTSTSTEIVIRSTALTGQEKPLAVCFATDGCCFSELEQKIVLGPGSIEQAHRCDEWISVEQLQKGADVYEALIHDWFNRPSSLDH